VAFSPPNTTTIFEVIKKKIIEPLNFTLKIAAIRKEEGIEFDRLIVRGDPWIVQEPGLVVNSGSGGEQKQLCVLNILN
jgi:hypothetical protein